MNNLNKTNKKYWDNYWEERIETNPLIPIIEEGLILKELERLIKTYSKSKNLSVLEIGGAPGRICEWISRLNNVKTINIIDYSSEGIRQSKSFLKDNCSSNYSIYELDLFKSNLKLLPPVDVVYSLGFVEHFYNLNLTIEKHMDLTKKGGLIIIGLPVYLGFNKWISKIFSPVNLKTHFLSTMEMSNWEFLNRMKNVKIIRKNYIGGFNPDVHWRLEKNSIIFKLMYKIFNNLIKPFIKSINIIKDSNSKYLCYYMLVAFKKL